jgi:hypothetical protein
MDDVNPEAPLTLDLRTTPTMQQDLVAPDPRNIPMRAYPGNGALASGFAIASNDDRARPAPSAQFRSRLNAAFETERYD